MKRPPIPIPVPNHRLKTWIRRLLLWFLVLTVLPVLALRFCPPPRSMFMVRNEIATWFDDKPGYGIHYHWVAWEDISGYAALAAIASEDQKFAEHYGFDFSAMFSAWKHNQGRKKIRGGSTISQQTAKNLFLTPHQSYFRKCLEAYLTLLIESLWPKRRILEVYLNVAQFGDGVYGIGEAARIYFHKSAKQLTAAEAAALASVLPNPIKFQVKRPGPMIAKRRLWIMAQMRQLGGLGHLQALD